jgi:TPR repeat protein
MRKPSIKKTYWYQDFFSSFPFSMFLKAAEQNDYRADYCLGVIYDRGLGVNRDAKEARKWYERAAAKGQIQATKSLANMDVTGDGGKVDRIRAFLLYGKTCGSGKRGSGRFAKPDQTQERNHPKRVGGFAEATHSAAN